MYSTEKNTVQFVEHAMNSFLIGFQKRNIKSPDPEKTT